MPGTQTRARNCSISPLPKHAAFTLVGTAFGLPAMDFYKLALPATLLQQVGCFCGV